MNAFFHTPWGATSFALFLSIIPGHYLVVGGLWIFLRMKEERKEDGKGLWIAWLFRRMKNGRLGPENPALGKAHPRAWGVGFIERTIYTSCMVFGLPIELIGGWLVLKGLAQFRPSGNDKASTEDFLTDYYSYLIGTGLSLIVGVGFGLLGRHLMGFPLWPDKSETKVSLSN
jgi:hypothetical protein